MTASPLATMPLFHIGPLGISAPVVISWAIIAVLTLASAALTRRLSLTPTKTQAALELLVGTVEIRDTMQAEPAPYRAFIGTLFLLILACNWSSLIPGVDPSTAHLETDAALAGIVFCATIVFGIRARGPRGYLMSFAEPSWIMIPLNLVEQITRTFSLFVRLFGNVMSGAFVIGIVLSLAALIVPIPLMVLELLTGAVQAYIFTVLAMVFIGAALAKPGHAVSKEETKRS
jgi:F-type H+-transporting ATPase subunit a